MRDAAIGILVVIALGAFLFLLMSGSESVEEAGKPDESSGSKPKGAGEKPDKQKPAFRVALVTPGPVNDGGWSQNAFKGLKRIETELKADTAHAVAKDPLEAFDTFRAYANDGYSMIIGHASEWFDPKLHAIADKAPSSVFVISGCEKEAVGSVSGARFVLEDATYALGYLAGLMTKSGVLGCVGPKKIPVIESTFYAFENGARAARKDIDVRVTWTNSWDDVARAKEQTLALIAEKADLIFHNANNGGPGVFQAVQEKKEQGVFAFGSNDDQSDMAPDVILASAVLDIPSVFLDTARAVKEGRFESKTQMLGMPEGYVWVAYNKALQGKIDPDIKKKTDLLIERIRERQLQVERKVLK